MSNFSKYRDMPFPDNLYEALHFDMTEQINIERGIRLENALDSYLDERRQTIILMYFQDRMTLNQIGNEIGITQERVRQLMLKGLRILRQPRVSRFVIYGEIDCPKQPIEGRPTIQQMMDTPVEGYLSRRTFNALSRRARVFFRDNRNLTLYDIYVLNDDDLRNTRNLGARGIQEVKEFRKRMSLECKHPVVEFRYEKNKENDSDVMLKCFIDGIEHKLLGWNCNKETDQMPYIILEQSNDMDVMIIEGDYITQLEISKPYTERKDLEVMDLKVV